MESFLFRPLAYLTREGQRLSEVIQPERALQTLDALALEAFRDSPTRALGCARTCGRRLRAEDEESGDGRTGKLFGCEAGVGKS